MSRQIIKISADNIHPDLIDIKNRIYIPFLNFSELKIVIIGYSFSDEHINNFLLNAIKKMLGYLLLTLRHLISLKKVLKILSL